MHPKNIIRILALLAAVIAWPLHATEILREEFNYPDGLIHQTSRRAWTVNNGSPAIAIENRAALPGGAEVGCVTRKFAAKPAAGQATATLLVRFDGPVQPGKGRLVLFQFTDESGKKRRGRLFMRAGSGNETVQLGVTSKNASDAVWGNAAMMWNFAGSDAGAFLADFCAQYFDRDHDRARKIARLYHDYYYSYWRQKKADLPGFDRQYIFQDLRYARAAEMLLKALDGDARTPNPLDGHPMDNPNTGSVGYFRVEPGPGDHGQLGARRCVFAVGSGVYEFAVALE
jgi:hypothetical protein